MQSTSEEIDYVFTFNAQFAVQFISGINSEVYSGNRYCGVIKDNAF